MSDNVTWEPMQPGEQVDYDMTIGSNSELRVVTELGEMVVEFDDDVRVCRAVAAPTWSQEPPKAEGWFWFVGTLNVIDDDEHVIDHARCSRPSAVFVRADGYVNYDGLPWLTSGSDGYWLPATVPQPPGEVGNA